MGFILIKKGKYLINLQIASLLLLIFAHCTKKLIELNWYDQNMENPKNVGSNIATNVNRTRAEIERHQLQGLMIFYGQSKFQRGN